MPILVKSEARASKLITGDRAIEDFIPGFTANKIGEMPAAADAHLAGVVTSGGATGEDATAAAAAVAAMMDAAAES